MKPKPKAVLELRGSRWAKDRQDVALPDDNQAPPCPKWLESRAKRTWHVLIKQLHAMRIVGLVDQAALGRYCFLFWQWRDIAERLETIDDPLSREYVAHVRLGLDLSDRLLRLEGEFGMTPSARASLGLLLVKAATHATQDDPEKDKRRFFTVG